MCKGRDFPGVSPQDIYQQLNNLVMKGEPGVLATVVQTDEQGPAPVGCKLLLQQDGSIIGTVGGGAAEAQVIEVARELLSCGGSRFVEIEPGADGCGGRLSVFLESLVRGFPFWVIGAGHVGRALVELGRNLPFRFTLVDEREEYLDGLNHEFAGRTLVADPATLRKDLEVVPGAAVLIASSSHELDFEYLQVILAIEEAAQVQFSYLGLLASGRKVEKFRQRMLDNQQQVSRLDQAQMPVGLDLGDASPHGIALSILAEAVAVLNNRPHLLDEEGKALGLPFHRRRNG